MAVYRPVSRVGNEKSPVITHTLPVDGASMETIPRNAFMLLSKVQCRLAEIRRSTEHRHIQPAAREESKSFQNLGKGLRRSTVDASLYGTPSPIGGGLPFAQHLALCIQYVSQMLAEHEGGPLFVIQETGWNRSIDPIFQQTFKYNLAKCQ